MKPVLWTGWVGCQEHTNIYNIYILEGMSDEREEEMRDESTEDNHENEEDAGAEAQVRKGIYFSSGRCFLQLFTLSLPKARVFLIRTAHCRVCGQPS